MEMISWVIVRFPAYSQNHSPPNIFWRNTFQFRWPICRHRFSVFLYHTHAPSAFTILIDPEEVPGSQPSTPACCLKLSSGLGQKRNLQGGRGQSLSLSLLLVPGAGPASVPCPPPPVQGQPAVSLPTSALAWPPPAPCSPALLMAQGHLTDEFLSVTLTLPSWRFLTGEVVFFPTYSSIRNTLVHNELIPRLPYIGKKEHGHLRKFPFFWFPVKAFLLELWSIYVYGSIS